MPDPLEQLALVGPQRGCLDNRYCKNSPANSMLPKCNLCRLAPGNKWNSLGHWEPLNPKYKNRILEQEKKDEKRKKAAERIKVRKNKDSNRQSLLKKAKRAEARTERAIIKATKNSGRSHRDGDHISGGHIVLDTKLQSQVDNPIVRLQELDKVRADAKRNGYLIAALVIRNKTNRGVVVLTEEDFAKLTAKESQWQIKNQ